MEPGHRKSQGGCYSHGYKGAIIFLLLWNFVSLQNENIQKQQVKHSNMRRIYQSLPCKSFEEGEFIATQWLTNWLSGSDDIKPVDNSAILCEHSKLNPDKFREFKLVSSKAVLFSAALFLTWRSNLWRLPGQRIVRGIPRRPSPRFQCLMLGLRNVKMHRFSP